MTRRYHLFGEGMLLSARRDFGHIYHASIYLENRFLLFGCFITAFAQALCITFLLSHLSQLQSNYPNYRIKFDNEPFLHQLLKWEENIFSELHFITAELLYFEYLRRKSLLTYNFG